MLDVAAMNPPVPSHRMSQLCVTYSDDSSDSSDTYDLPPNSDDEEERPPLPPRFETKSKVHVLEKSLSSADDQESIGNRAPKSREQLSETPSTRESKMTARVHPVQQVHTNRQSLELTRPDISAVPWYHGPLSRHAAEGVLLASSSEGGYLIRDSNTDPTGFSLSVKCRQAVKHFKVSYSAGKFTFGLVTFNDLQTFLDHFKREPLIGGETGTSVVLKYPHYRDVVEPGIYEQATVHTELGPTASNEDWNQNTNVPFASKSGFLTKLGGRRKTWRKRYFVMEQDTLKYFKREQDVLPLRAIDLTKAIDLSESPNCNKPNCFSLCLPDRTFYMYAGSKKESDEWIHLLRWKMDHNLKRKATRLSSVS